MYYLIFLILLAFQQTAFAKIDVFACEPEWGALVSVIGQDKVKVFNATTGLQDPHYIQARPSLLAKARRAELLICTGAELEAGWLPVIMQKANNPKILPNQPGYIMATDHVILLEQPTVLDRAEGDIHAAGNPHIQVNPYYLAQIGEVVLERLILIDPANQDFYQQNHTDFAQKWQNAIQGWEAKAAILRDKNIVVYHKQWVYLSEWLELNRVATLEPKPGIPPTTQHLSRVLAELEVYPADMIIYASYQNAKPANWLSQRTNLPIVELPSTVGGTKQATDLFSLLDVIIDRLTAAAS